MKKQDRSMTPLEQYVRNEAIIACVGWGILAPVITIIMLFVIWH